MPVSSLHSILKQKIKFSNKEIIDFSKKIFTILKLIHTEGIIHRNLKPHNILISSDYDPIITDFSIAEYYNESNTFSFKNCGTPGFIAPEVLYDWNYDYKIDVFSIGVTLFWM